MTISSKRSGKSGKKRRKECSSVSQGFEKKINEREGAVEEEKKGKKEDERNVNKEEGE